MRYFLGFSLLEILITLVIISIVAGFCIPLYSQHLTNERRLEAKIALEKAAAALEEYYTLHNTYQGATLENLGFSLLIVKNNYRLAVMEITDNTFSLRAIPLESQAQEDRVCGTLILNEAGKKDKTGNGKLSDCWG
ncbi:MAG: pilE 1 [Gammaproteobacteria bacterium]|jgi:type IV pilus assembly protein PilE|nr:pilE 1 [Gammaproteobacteria bacterium]